jgi:hypothetical protein
MPLLLAALVLRVLIPSDLMMGAMGPASLMASMCATASGGKIEKIELPGGRQLHCEYCAAPPPGAPPALLAVTSPVLATATAFRADVAQVEVSTLFRAQSARAPPRV